MPYCDNIHCLGVDRDQCNHGKQRIVDDLSGLGCTIHEDESADTCFSTLGGFVDGKAGHVKMTSRCVWDLITAFEHVATHAVSSYTMQRLLLNHQ